MKDKKIFRKWWFWVLVVVVLGAVGAATQSSSETTTNDSPSSSEQPTDSKVTGTLPKLSEGDYSGKEGLVVYKDLKTKGYTVDADFENQALTDINGKASTMFEPLDVNKADDRKSVDAFVVSGITQTGDTVKLIIVKTPN
ncbi:TPA: hypothetical protein DIV49_02340 [Candidatus Saccharibacteria bacterium]|nr:hypothetical protein [Candidatus Saccharibacteria bacterium]HRJ90990.1 hypothetical protein [Candidatus Saccharibacteria bacterium]